MTTWVIPFERIFGPASEAEVEAYESRLGTRLPDDYRRFLLEVDGGWPDESRMVIDESVREMVDVLYSLSGGWEGTNIEDIYGGPFPPGFLAIGHDPGGNSFLLKLDGDDRGTVWFWDHELEHPDIPEPAERLLAPHFVGFLNSLQAGAPKL